MAQLRCLRTQFSGKGYLPMVCLTRFPSVQHLKSRFWFSRASFSHASLQFSRGLQTRPYSRSFAMEHSVLSSLNTKRFVFLLLGEGVLLGCVFGDPSKWTWKPPLHAGPLFHCFSPFFCWVSHSVSVEKSVLSCRAYPGLPAGFLEWF